MSIKTKKRFKNFGKIVGIGLFTLLMLTNIKMAILDGKEIASGDISLFGIELTLFEAIYATQPGNIDCAILWNCITDGTDECGRILNNPGPGYTICFYIDIQE